MKSTLSALLLIFCIQAFATRDTLYVDDPKDPRLLRYKDSLWAYQTGYSVAKNIAAAVRESMGNNSLDAYFLSYYNESGKTSEGYFFSYEENPKVQIGHVHTPTKGLKSDTIIPWQYIEKQYKRLDSLRIPPVGIQQGAELPVVYVYSRPHTTVIFRKMLRYTVVDPSIKFYKKDDGKTKVSYILKYHYSKIGNEREKIDSIEKLDPVTLKRVDF